MKKILTLTLLLSFAACVGGGGGGDSKGGASGDGATLSATDLVERITLSDHKSSCYNNGEGGYNTEKLTAGSGAVYLQLDIFSDSGCSTRLVTIDLELTYTMGSALNGVTNGYDLDYSVDVGTASIASGGATILNALNGGSGFCGKSDWSDSDNLVNILGTLNCPIEYTSSENVFDIIKYDTANNKVSFGDKSGASDGTTTGKRPTTFDTITFNKL